MNTITKLALLSAVLAFPDVRQAPEQKGAPADATDRVPSTFGYKALENQKKNNNDQFLRSNIDNEANKRNEGTETARDMLPCRQDNVANEKMVFTLGVPVEMPLRWNNPHDSDCEVNAFINGLTQVVPIKRPTNCGGGYQDQRFSFTVPTDFTGCTTAAEKCVMQVYAHSVEPRTYAMCIDFTIAPQGAGLQKRQAVSADPKDVTQTVVQPAKQYQDSFDTSHVDSTHSVYRGQQPEFIRNELACSVKMQSFVGNGGLVPLGNIDKQLAKETRDKIQQVIKSAESDAKANNRAAQRLLDQEAKANGTPKKCFEGELYNVVNNANCRRLFTNTYVTNVGYCQILEAMLPMLQSTGLTQYAAKLKGVDQGLTTPEDPFGSFKVKGKASLVAQGKGGAKPNAPFDFPAGQPAQLTNLASQSKTAPSVKFSIKTVELMKKLGGNVSGLRASKANVKAEPTEDNPDDKDSRN